MQYTSSDMAYESGCVLLAPPHLEALLVQLHVVALLDQLPLLLSIQNNLQLQLGL